MIFGIVEGIMFSCFLGEREVVPGRDAVKGEGGGVRCEHERRGKWSPQEAQCFFTGGGEGAPRGCPCEHCASKGREWYTTVFFYSHQDSVNPPSEASASRVGRHVIRPLVIRAG